MDSMNMPIAGGASRQSTKLACLVISSGAFIAWLALMVTIVAENGSALEIAAITLLPLLAHIASVTLTASAAAEEAQGKSEEPAPLHGDQAA